MSGIIVMYGVFLGQQIVSNSDIHVHDHFTLLSEKNYNIHVQMCCINCIEKERICSSIAM